MNIFLDFFQFLKTWGYLIAIFSFLFSLFNLILGKVVTRKIQDYDLKIIKNVMEELRTKSDDIISRVGKVEKEIGIHKAICEERHTKDK